MSVNLVNQTDASLAPIAGGTLYADEPIGAILPFGGSTVPNGFLLCNGTAVSRTTYAELFGVIGTSFGAGDGSTTFNVPDLRGKVPVGYNSSESEFNTLGKTGGTKTVTLTAAQIPAHTHPLGYAGNIYAGSGPTGYWTDYDSPTTAYTRATQANTGGGGAHNNLQPYNTVNYIIKATTIALPSDFEKIIDSKIPEYAHGEETVSLLATTATNVTITFPSGKFTSVPTVTATIKCQNMQVDNYNAWKEVSVIMKPDFSVTGGTIVLLNASSQALPVLLNWIAIN